MRLGCEQRQRFELVQDGQHLWTLQRRVGKRSMSNEDKCHVARDAEHHATRGSCRHRLPYLRPGVLDHCRSWNVVLRGPRLAIILATK